MTTVLEHFLVAGGEPPSADSLQATALGGYAYTVLPAEHPLRSELRPEYLAALARHHQIKRELLPLLRAWRTAGIHVLLFKGFSLAEFVYPAPGMRFHGDVDVLIRPEDEGAALRIAKELGWAGEVDSRALGKPYSHGVCNLFTPNGATQVDLHRLLLHSRHPWNRTQRRSTDAVWERSEVVQWEGIEVRLPDPVDALLVLALQRSWGDRWALKPHDALDFKYLAERAGDGWRETITGRARELGCARTLQLFLSRCDPERAVLRLAAPTSAQRRRWNLAVVRERPLLWTGWVAARIPLLPVAGVAVAAALPRVLRVRRSLRRERDIHDLLRAVGPAHRRSEPGSYTERVRIVRGIRWALRLFPHNEQGDCLARSLAIYAALREKGWPVEFVSGVRRTADGVVGHAWVELEGRVLPELAEPHNARLYQVNLRYPDLDASGRARPVGKQRSER